MNVQPKGSSKKVKTKERKKKSKKKGEILVYLFS